MSDVLRITPQLSASAGLFTGRRALRDDGNEPESIAGIDSETLSLGLVPSPAF